MIDRLDFGICAMHGKALESSHPCLAKQDSHINACYNVLLSYIRSPMFSFPDLLLFIDAALVVTAFCSHLEWSVGSLYHAAR